MAAFLTESVNGLGLAAIYALVALGITLVFGLTRLINFAHGALVMVGAMVTVLIGGSGLLMFAVAGLVAIVIIAIVSAVLEVALFRHTLVTPLNGFIVSLGLILFFDNIALAIWGGTARVIQPPFSGTLIVGDFRVAYQRLFTIAVGLVVIALFFLLMRRTQVGAAVRAIADDPEASRWVGIPVSRLILIVFVIGGVLASVAGTLYAGLYPVTTDLGDNLVIFGFVVALLGGLGSPVGALIASVVVALAQTYLGPTSYAQWDVAFALCLVAVGLLIRPSVLLGGRAAHG
jgi:branched-chain amino acid transport system permease protein